jgi:hypothetical protein
MASSTLEDIFELLTLANSLEEAGTQRIEAATKVRRSGRSYFRDGVCGSHQMQTFFTQSF